MKVKARRGLYNFLLFLYSRFLQNNLIDSISNETFCKLKDLEIL